MIKRLIGYFLLAVMPCWILFILQMLVIYPWASPHWFNLVYVPACAIAGICLFIGWEFIVIDSIK